MYFFFFSYLRRRKGKVCDICYCIMYLLGIGGVHIQSFFLVQEVRVISSDLSCKYFRVLSTI